MFSQGLERRVSAVRYNTIGHNNSLMDGPTWSNLRMSIMNMFRISLLIFDTREIVGLKIEMIKYAPGVRSANLLSSFQDAVHWK